MNQFKLPRMSLIHAINHAYNQVGRVYFSLSPEESGDLDTQLSQFAERTATINTNDPDALMEFKGEGRVISLGVALWHHFNAKSVKAGWARDAGEFVR